ncbi:MAG TPA: EAL domain-containing protein [Kineosporiaceae bacterium]|nr:EAL domain-containing protein [Kineosporiaceae bacterium]
MGSLERQPRRPGPLASPADTVQRVLALARTYLRMDVAWLSELRGEEQVLTYVEASDAAGAPSVDSATAISDSYCARVLDGRLPAVVPDSAVDPVASRLAVTRELGIGSYVGVPVRTPDGALRGMLCCVSGTAQPELTVADVRVLEMLAAVLGELAGDDARAAALETVRLRTHDAISGRGRTMALQPIVDVPTGIATGVEALARFDSPQATVEWFAQAEPVGLRLQLELAAARTALAALDRPGHAGYLSLNLSPEAILSEEFPQLLAAADPASLVVEITEHVAVQDYDALSAVLRRYRDAGLRLAVDDAGAGYASLLHILKLRPDYIKIDLSLVRDIHLDPARQALVSSLVSFARTVDAVLVAEGVEQQAELDMLVTLGVRQMQGYLLCPPCANPPTTGFRRPSRHVGRDRGAIPA